MMQTIYQRARMVIIWLGEELASDREGFDLALKLYDMLRDREKENATDFATIDHEALGIPHADSPRWRSLMTLLGRPWFQRIWIVQEFICAKACTMWCGQIKFQPEVLMVSARLLSKFQNLVLIVAALGNDNSIYYTTRVNEIASLWTLKETIRQSKNQGLKLMGLLWLTLAFRAKYPCDKVFAVVGLAYGVSADFIDYNLSTREVFIQTAKFLIQDNPTNPLGLISLMREDRPDYLPSWVPDWKTSQYCLVPLARRYPNSIPPSSLQGCSAKFEFLSGDILAVQGKIIDTISSLHICPYSDPSKTTTQKLASWFLDLSTWINICARLTQESPRYGSEKEKKEVFWRALIFDTTAPRGFDVPGEEYAEAYYAFHKLVEYELMIERIAPRVNTPAAHQSWELMRAVLSSKSQLYHTTIGNFVQGRQFCLTSSGYIGWAPLYAQPGDKVCIFLGYPIPFVIRPDNRRGPFRLVGEGYLQGLMDRKAIQSSHEPLGMIELA